MVVAKFQAVLIWYDSPVNLNLLNRFVQSFIFNSLPAFFSYKVNPQVNLRLVNDRLVITMNDLNDNDTILVGPNILNLAGGGLKTSHMQACGSGAA